MIPDMHSAFHTSTRVERYAKRRFGPHRTLSYWAPFRFVKENTQSTISTMEDSLITTARSTPTNILAKDEELDDDDDEPKDEDFEWDDSNTGSSTTATSSIVSTAPSTTTEIITSMTPDPTVMDTELPTMSPSTEGSHTTTESDPTISTAHPFLETSTPMTNPTASPFVHFSNTEWTTTIPTTEQPKIHWVWTYAPATPFPTHSPSSPAMVKSVPKTHAPTYYPTYSPTYTLIQPMTAKPTPFPSQVPVVLVRISLVPSSSFVLFSFLRRLLLSSIDHLQTTPPTDKVATNAPAVSASAYPSTTPTMEPSPHPQEVLITNVPSIAGTLVPSSQGSITVEGILSFQLNMDRLLEDNVAAFESIAEHFLQESLSLKLILDYNSELSFSSYDVVVASQTLVPREQPVSTNRSDEPLRFRSLRSSNTLFIFTTVTALGAPAELAADFPFQTAISVVVMENTDMFYDTLFSSDAFRGMRIPEKTLEYVELNGSDAGINKPLVYGSSIAGIVVFLFLAGAFFAMQRYHDRKTQKMAPRVEPSAAWTVRNGAEEVGDCKVSCSNVGFQSNGFLHVVPPFLDEDGNDLSSLDDSLNPDNPKTISHDGSDLSSLEASMNNYSKIISHEDSDSSSEDSLRSKKSGQNDSREDISCFEDSLNPANYPQNVPHFPFSFDGDVSMNVSADLENQGDEWSLDDNFPLIQEENELTYKMNHSYMTDSEESSTTLSITSADLEGSLLSYVENACTLKTDQDGSLLSYVGTVNETTPSPRNALKLAGKIHK